MDIKLIAFDIDGTLINSKGEVLEETRGLIKDLREKGYRVVLCTGRPFNGYWWIREGLDLMGEDDISINSTGAHIRENATGRDIAKKVLSKADIEKIASFKDDDRVNFAIWTRDIIYTNDPVNDGFLRDQYLLDMPRLKYESIDDIPQDLTRACFTADADVLDEFEKRHREELEKDYMVMRNAKNIMEILNKKAGKLEAMTYLVDYLSIDLDNVIYFGDGANDVKTLKAVGVGVAMGNGREATKEAADQVIGTNDEPSIADFLRDYLDV